MKGKTICKTLGLVLLALLILVVLYVVYVFASYHRVGDQSLSVMHCSSRDAVPMEDAVETGAVYRVSSANAGFGAYSADYSFFMDTDGTRSWHIDETAYLSDAMTGCEFDEVFAQNYDSPYLFYPLIQPHGANQSGIVTLSRHPIASAARRELPVESGFMKLLDLDRCYSVSRIPTASGKELVLYNLHLSAYTSDGAIATEQLELLCADMLAEYEAGNYCVAGGDFNKDLLGNSPEIFGVAAGENDTWAQPIPEGTIPAGLTLVAPFDETAPAASCRTASEPYSIETTFRLTVDGFLVSDNVEVVDSAVLDAGFLYSDHNPVWMDFKLN